MCVRNTRLALGALLLALLLARPVHAQTQIPDFLLYGPTDSSLAIQAGEAVFNIQDMVSRAWTHRRNMAIQLTRDSIRIITRLQAQAWLARLPRDEAEALQTESYIRVLALAGDDSDAERVIAKRLALPGLSFAARAYTLYAAVAAFTDPTMPYQFALAERYLARLNACGPEVALRRYEAELTIMDAYDRVGRTSDVARHGISAIHLVPLLALRDGEALHETDHTPYLTIVRAVAAQPGGPATIAEMNRILTAASVVSADSVALDSTFFYESQTQARDNKQLVTAVERVGTVPGPLISNLWLNWRDSVGRMPTNDGTIRVLQVSAYGCPGCVAMAKWLQSTSDADSLIHPVLLTYTTASWGNRVVPPDSSAGYLTAFWTKQVGLRFPIALWVARQRDTLADGEVIQSLRDDSTLAWYPEDSWPQFYVVDGAGRIRASFFGGGFVTEHQIVETVHRLAVAVTHQSAVSTP